MLVGGPVLEFDDDPLVSACCLLKLSALAIDYPGNEIFVAARPVAPTPLPLEHPLARLRNTGMGVLFHTDLLGTLLISVEGDSPLGTAQAMLRDVVNIGRERLAPPRQPV